MAAAAGLNRALGSDAVHSLSGTRRWPPTQSNPSILSAERPLSAEISLSGKIDHPDAVARTNPRSQ